MNKNLNEQDIGKEFKKILTTQDYSESKKIDGVKILEIRQFNDDGGSFSEILRIKSDLVEGFPGFDLKQINYSEMLPGSIKAFHLHFKQEDIWFVPSFDRLVIGLLDIREKSTTYKVSQRISTGAGKSLLVYIPRGVAHGAANLSGSTARIIYFVNQQFNLKNPDEKRFTWDSLGGDFWEMQKG